MIDEHCSHCGASLKKYWHRLTPGLINTLVKVYVGISSKGENVITKDELDLTHSEYGNFQKLRFHALIAKHKVDGKWNRRDWLITRRGVEFLKDQIKIPYRVQTFRNKVVAHDAKKIGISEAMGAQPCFEGYEEFKNQLDFMVFPDAVVEETPAIRSYSKRGKKLVCSCGGQVTMKITPMGVSEAGNMIVSRHLVCKLCHFDFGEQN